MSRGHKSPAVAYSGILKYRNFATDIMEHEFNEPQGTVRLLFSDGRAEKSPLSNTYRESPISAL